MGEACFLRHGCPCLSGVCSSKQPDDDGCPVYRWVRDKVMEQEIVHCRDCVYHSELKTYETDRGRVTIVDFQDDSICPYKCEDFFYSRHPDDDWYCANGKRRTEG